MPHQKNDCRIKPLKGKKEISLLFENGTQYHGNGLILRFCQEEGPLLSVGVTVSKKNFSKAVDRNRIKRLLRAAIKEQDVLFSFGGKGMLVYTGKKMPDLFYLIKEVKDLFNKV